MSAIIAAVLSLVQSLPEAQKLLRELFSKPDPTDADWATLRAKVLAKKYEDYVPASKLPPDGP